MLSEDQPARDFTLPDQDGNVVTLSKLKGQSVVLYFYPKDDTPGCTAEACAFRDAKAAYKKAGAVVLGVSPDSTESHRAFAKKFKLPFTLLADTNRTVCEAYGIWKEKTLYGRKFWGVERTTIVIDREGVVRKVFGRVRVPGHSDKVLEILATIK